MRALLATALVALLALALGAWLFLGGAGLSDAPEVAAAGPARAGEATREEAPHPRAGSGASAVEEVDTQGRTPLAATPAEEETERAPDDDARVCVVGRLVCDARPIAAASVYLGRSLGWPGPALDSRFYASTGWAQRVRTTSDADGRFAFEGVQRGAVNLAVRAAGFAPLDQGDVQVNASGVQDLGDLVLVAGAVLEGVVLDERGAPVAGAELVRPDEGGLFFRMDTSARGALLATSADDGGFRIDTLAPGPWRIVVSTPDHPDLVAEGTTNRARPRLGGLVLRLAAGRAISGRVDAPEGTDLSALLVRARRKGPVDFDPRSGLSPWREAPCAADGGFSVGGLADDGAHVLTLVGEASRDGRRKALSEPVEALAGARDVVLTLAPSSEIAFRVVDAVSDAPLEEYTVELRRSRGDELAGSETYTNESEQVTRDAQGVTTLGELRDLREGLTTRVTLHAPGHRPWTSDALELTDGRRVDLGRIALEATPRMLVRVVDASDDAPLEGATVTLRAAPATRDRAGTFDLPATPSPYGESSARADADGLARVALPPDSEALLSATCEGHAPSDEVEVELAGFEPAGDAPDRVLRLERGGGVEVRVVDPQGAPAPGARVTCTRADREDADSTTRTTDASGVALFEGLPAGAHVLEVPAPERRGIVISIEPQTPRAIDPRSQARVDVVAGERAQVTLVRPAQGRLVGRVTEAGHALAGAGLRLEGGGLGGGFVIPGLTDQPWTHTDGAGRYTIEPVEPGTFELVVQHRSRVMDARVAVTIGEGETTLDVDLPVTGIEGRVRDAEGRPVEGAEVRVRAQGGDDLGGRMSILIGSASDDGVRMSFGGDAAPATRSGPDGLYRLHGVRADVDLVVTVRHPEHRAAQSAPLRLAPDELRTDLDFALEPAGRVEVLVRTGAGAAPVGVPITASWAGDEEAQVEEVTARTDAKGVAVLEGLAPGAWLLRAAPAGWDDEALAKLAPRAVDVVAGELGHVELDLP